MAVDLSRVQDVVKILVSMGARKILLFGSSSEHPDSANDIDIAVDGIPDNRILDADVKVGEILQQPFDLVSSEQNPEFFKLISRHGKLLYG